MKFRFISDPGHGWLEAPISLVETLGLTTKVSSYSYRKGAMAYLEEDCDAYLFMDACKRNGITVELDEIHQDPTPIRGYSRFAA